MVVDTSIIIAILMDEPDAIALTKVLSKTSPKFISAATLFETAIVIETRNGTAGGQKLDELIQRAQIQVMPVTLEQTNAARQAYRTFGKGRHPASLNFGDCFSYALAKVTGHSLLFKGNDFNQTDIPFVAYAIE